MKLFIILLIGSQALLAQQNNWGSGMASGMSGAQNCGYNMTMGRELQNGRPGQGRGQSQVNQEEIKDLTKQIQELNKEKTTKKKELLKAQRQLQVYDSKLSLIFDNDSYQFIKSHFDDGNRCQDYKGYAEEEGGQNLNFSSKKLAKDWAQVCDVENNSKAQLSSSVCSKEYLVRTKDSSCASVVSQYPVTKHNVENLKKEIEEITNNISSLKDNLKEVRNAKAEDGDSAGEMFARDSGDTEAGVCIECMNRNSSSSSSSGLGSLFKNANLGSLIGNSAMALMAYNSTNSFYENMADKNANLGYPTAMPAGSPFMAASPYILGAINAGVGSGSFGCAGQGGAQGGMQASGAGIQGFGQMGSMYGGNSGIGGSSQIGGAFGMPQWAMGNQMTSGLGNSMNNYSGLTALMGSGNLGISSSGIPGLGNGISGNLSMYGSLYGNSGINSLYGNNLGGLNTSAIQMQLQQQQYQSQQQMSYYQNSLQKTQAMTGLQTELAGLLQRIQTVQSSVNYGSNYSSGTTGTYGGLPTSTTYSGWGR